MTKDEQNVVAEFAKAYVELAIEVAYHREKSGAIDFIETLPQYGKLALRFQPQLQTLKKSANPQDGDSGTELLSSLQELLKVAGTLRWS